MAGVQTIDRETLVCCDVKHREMHKNVAFSFHLPNDGITMVN